MRLIDAEKLESDYIDRVCNDCTKRKGIKDGKYKVIYEIGDAPCRACSADDMFAELENAPTVDAVRVVRCQKCKHYNGEETYTNHRVCEIWHEEVFTNGFCYMGEKKEQNHEQG